MIRPAKGTITDGIQTSICSGQLELAEKEAVLLQTMNRQPTDLEMVSVLSFPSMAEFYLDSGCYIYIIRTELRATYQRATKSLSLFKKRS